MCIAQSWPTSILMQWRRGTCAIILGNSGSIWPHPKGMHHQTWGQAIKGLFPHWIWLSWHQWCKVNWTREKKINRVLCCCRNVRILQKRGNLSLVITCGVCFCVYHWWKCLCSVVNSDQKTGLNVFPRAISLTSWFCNGFGLMNFTLQTQQRGMIWVARGIFGKKVTHNEGLTYLCRSSWEKVIKRACEQVEYFWQFKSNDGPYAGHLCSRRHARREADTLPSWDLKKTKKSPLKISTMLLTSCG